MTYIQFNYKLEIESGYTNTMKNEFNTYRLLKILYLLQNSKHYDYMKLLKLYYFAEKYHLRTYGLFMNDDEYYAMKYGTIASSAKDVLSKNIGYLQNISNEEEKFINDNITFDKDNKCCVVSEQDTSTLSKSAIKAIEFALEYFSKFDQLALSEITHDYIEWKKHKDKIEVNQVPRVLENIEDFFINPEIKKSPFIKKYLKEDIFAKDIEHTDYVYKNFINNKILAECINKPLQ